MTERQIEVIPDTIVCAPDLVQNEGEQLFRLAEDGAPPAPGVLSMAVMRVIDLTKSHGIDVTLEKLQQMVAVYDPTVEQASLNFDHAWGGPSYGWCEEIWLEGDLLWARYVDVDPTVFDGIRAKRWVRRSSEFCLHHKITGSWYYTGCALLGQNRPAVPGLPPIQLLRPSVRLVLPVPPKEEEPPMSKPAVNTPPEQEPAPTPANPATEEVTELLAAGRRELTLLREQNAQLQVGRILTDLGTRVTPGMRKTLEPLLLHLHGSTPQTIKLDLGKGPVDTSVAAAIVEVLKAAPEFESLGGRRLAEEDPPAPGIGGLTAERVAELEAKYHFQGSPAFRANN